MPETDDNEIPPFVDPNTDFCRCYFCDRSWLPTEIEGFDLSGEEDYYPKMVPCCPQHRGCR